MRFNFDFSIIKDLIREFEADIASQTKTNPVIDVYTFPQMWGSTALGYDGIGGSAMTTAQTIVLCCKHLGFARVYFGGKRLAYEIEKPNKAFFVDLQNYCIASCSGKDRYISWAMDRPDYCYKV